MKMIDNKLYKVWVSMRNRCNNKNHGRYKYYSHINICEDWSTYSGFEKWALTNNYGEDLELIRKDKNGDYEPNNCFFGTHSEALQNRAKWSWFRLKV